MPARARAALRCFDPRPREGATSCSVSDRYTTDVSIRAPVRGRLAAQPDAAWTDVFRSAPP